MVASCSGIVQPSLRVGATRAGVDWAQLLEDGARSGMFLFLILALGVLVATTWLAMNPQVAGGGAVRHRLTAAGLTLCLVIAVVAVAVAW